MTYCKSRAQIEIVKHLVIPQILLTYLLIRDEVIDYNSSKCKSYNWVFLHFVNLPTCGGLDETCLQEDHFVRAKFMIQSPIVRCNENSNATNIMHEMCSVDISALSLV